MSGLNVSDDTFNSIIMAITLQGAGPTQLPHDLRPPAAGAVTLYQLRQYIAHKLIF